MEGGFEQSKRDYDLFYQRKGTKFCIILVYVDDLLIRGNEIEYIEVIKQKLEDEFTLRNLGEIRYFLGLEVGRRAEGIMLN